ncbi:MAG: hypothetical protein JKX84_10185 [Flavobacteriales bacterium]|nr:hypothetical protein [Flavobacteriales bacterium]
MSYTIKALIVFLMLMAATAVVNETTENVINAVHISFLLLFMYGTSVLVHWGTVRATNENPKRFPAYFMAITGLKMMVYLIAIGIYAYLFEKQATPMIVAFLIAYAIYTVLEVHSALAGLKKSS